MKKSVILILIAVYVLSIGIVGTIGLNVRVFAPNVKPTSITITQIAYLDKVEDFKMGTKEDGSQYKYFTQITTNESVLVFDLRYVIGPDDATDKTVIYSFDPENPNIKVENGKLVFTKPQSGRPIVAATVTLSPKENATISDSVYISVKFN